MVQALLNSGSKINAIILLFISKLDLKFCSTNDGAQKIDGFILKKFEITLASF